MSSLSNYQAPKAELLLRFDPLQQILPVTLNRLNLPADELFTEFKADVHGMPASGQLHIGEGDPLRDATIACYSAEPEKQEIGNSVDETAIQFSEEDSLFSGTHGELALRLIAALIHAKIPEGASTDRDELFKQAKLTFLGYKVWASNVTQQFYFEEVPDTSRTSSKKTVPKYLKVKVGELWDTVPENYVLEEVTGATTGRLKILNRRAVFYKSKDDFLRNYSANAKGLNTERVILAADSSFVFVSTGDITKDKLVYARLAEVLQTVHPSAKVPVVVVDNSASVLRALVTLTPLRSLGISERVIDFSVEASVIPYLDLKIGAWPPWLKLPTQELSGINLGQLEKILAYSVCPAFFVAGVCGVWDSSSTLGKFQQMSAEFVKSSLKETLSIQKALVAPPHGTPVFARFSYTEVVDGVTVRVDQVAIGYLDLLIQSLFKDNPNKDQLEQSALSAVRWTEINPRRLFLLFGPPLHLFVPERLEFGIWRDVKEACRLFPGVPKLQLPARLKESTPEEVRRAKEMLNALAPGGWTSNDTRPPRTQDTGRVQVSRHNVSGSFLGNMKGKKPSANQGFNRKKF